MSMMRRVRSRAAHRALSAATAGILATAAVLASAPASYADGSICASSASMGGGTAYTQIVCTLIEGHPGPGEGTFTGKYTPPACWVQPQYSPTDLKTYIEGQMNTGLSGVGSEGGQWLAGLDKMYLAMTPPYDIGEDGMWWGVTCDINNLTWSTAYEGVMAAAGLSPENPWKFVATGGDAGTDAVTPVMLAEIAKAQLTPPATDIAVNPGATQTVNLSTRVYSTGGLDTMEDSATLDGVGTSTVEAVATTVTITPGGPASLTVGGASIASLTCAVKNGAFGSADSDACAFYYDHSTASGGKYALKAVVTWKYYWIGHGGLGQAPAPAVDMAMPVQEIQTVTGG